jgi:hypothetical protein
VPWMLKNQFKLDSRIAACSDDAHMLLHRCISVVISCRHGGNDHNRSSMRSCVGGRHTVTLGDKVMTY